MPTQGDGTTTAAAPDWTLTVPDTGRALGTEVEPSGSPRPSQGAERAGRRILRAVGLAAVLVAVAALTVPITRTVEMGGQLVPEHVVTVRAAEPGLLTEVHVTAGDTIRPGQRLARLRSPDLDEAARASTGHDPALLARRARLDVHAPPWSERRSDGTADPSTFWRGGIVLTEDLREQRGARLDAGDTVLDVAAVGADGRVAHVVRAWADERQAQRARPGMPARLTFAAVPQERPRQVQGRVLRVGLAPDPARLGDVAEAAGWRVEIAVEPDDVAAIVGAAETPTELRAGFSVEVAVEERRETLAQTARRWVAARGHERDAMRQPPISPSR